MIKSTTKLKIGFVLDDSLDKTDGVQQYILTLGKWLSSNGHEVHYLVGNTKRSDIRHIHSLSRNIKVRFNGNRMSMPLPSSKSKLKSLLAEEKFDILHVQIPYSPYLAHRIILSTEPHTAIVGTFHIVGDSMLVKTASKLLKSWTKKSLQSFDEIVSVSEAAQIFAKHTYEINTAVLPNVIELDKFKNSNIKPINTTENEKVILFLGRLVERKGCLLLLQAIRLLQAEHNLPNYKVLICGTGPLENKLKSFVNENQLKHIVSFTGYVSEQDKPSIYASADIAVFPSRGGESFGIVLLEAMANGNTAVLAGNNVGYATVLKDRPSLLFNPNSAVDLKTLLSEYLLDDGLRSSVAKWCSEYVQLFDVNRVGPQIEQLYYQALHKHVSE